MKRKLAIVGIIALIFIIALGATFEKVFRGPVGFYSDVSGTRIQWMFCLEDLTADRFIWGDTTAAGMYVPPQPLELTNVTIWGDPDSGDTLCVVVYAANGAAANETVVRSDSLYGTAWAMKTLTYQSISSTYKTITATEGIAVLADFIAGTPNDVFVLLEWKTRIADAYE